MARQADYNHPLNFIYNFMKILRHRIGFIVALPMFCSMWLNGCTAKEISEMNKPSLDINARLQAIDQVVESGPFAADWQSLAEYTIPDWYQDAKFGIFIHWGAYSVPAFGSEWYPREMYIPGSPKGAHEHHVATYGPVDEFGYKDFIPMFKAERFDPDEWVALFKDSGARYIIPVAEHHDGFPMYASDYTHWDASEMGPKRDIIMELSQRVRAAGLHFGVSSHRAENWWFFGGGRKIPSDVQDDRYRELYGYAMDRDESEAENGTPPNKDFLDDWLLRCAELVDKFEPEVIWFDWWIAQPAFQKHLQTFSAYYYNRGLTWDNMVAINYKKFGGESFPDTAGVLDIERGGLADIRELYWQTDTSVSKNSWGYIENHDYKSVNSLVDDLIDIVSKNGCMLLNIGPRADGTIPEREQQMLREIGAWLKVNGEAIYGTRPWVKFGEGKTKVVDGMMSNDAERHRTDFDATDIRFTRNGDTLYAIVMDWPGPDGVDIRSLGTGSGSGFGKVSNVELIGHEGALDWEQTTDALSIAFPEQPCGQHAFVLRVQ